MSTLVVFQIIFITLTNFECHLRRVRGTGRGYIVREQYVLRLEVPMHDAFGVDGAHRLCELPQEQPDRALAEQPIGLEVVRQITAVAVLWTSVAIEIELLHSR